MIKSSARLLEQPTNISTIQFQVDPEMNFSLALDGKETQISEKKSERIEINVRYSRLKRRMRTRSSSIL